MAMTTLKVTGMSCDHCVRTVTRTLEEVEGVRQAEVDLEHGRARVEYDDATTSPEELAAVVTEEGYTAEEMP